MVSRRHQVIGVKRQSKVLLIALIAVSAATAWYGLTRDRGASPLAVATSQAAPPGAPAVPVTEGRAETRDVLIWLSGIGAVQPLNAVTVKVRVDGELDHVAFSEGQDVRKGDVLAQIDPRSFRAQLKQAQANNAKDEAQLANAKLDLERSTRLEAKGVASKQGATRRARRWRRSRPPSRRTKRQLKWRSCSSNSRRSPRRSAAGRGSGWSIRERSFMPRTRTAW